MFFDAAFLSFDYFPSSFFAMLPPRFDYCRDAPAILIDAAYFRHFAAAASFRRDDILRCRLFFDALMNADFFVSSPDAAAADEALMLAAH